MRMRNSELYLPQFVPPLERHVANAASNCARSAPPLPNAALPAATGPAARAVYGT